MHNDFTETLVDYVEGEIRRNSYGYAVGNKLVLGGDSGENGGSGAPWGGVVGQLCQRLVTYDVSQLATMSGYTATGIPLSGSLLHNLNYIRWHQIPATWFETMPTEPRSMSVTVNSGIWYYEEGKYLSFSGGTSPTITLPTTHPRLDVVYVDKDGLVGSNVGEEDPTPTITIPSGVLPVAAVYVEPAATAVGWPYETYGAHIYSDLRPFIMYGSGTGGVSTFLALTDTPESYVGEAHKVPRVRADETGLEFVTISGAGGAEYFTDLLDVPVSYAGEGGKSVTVKVDETGLEFTTISGGVSTFIGLTDTPASYAGEAHKIPRVKTDETGLEFVTISGAGGAEYFTDLLDVPASYAGEGGKVVAVKMAEDGLEFITHSGGGASTFLDLTDTPADYTGHANKLVRVNGAEDALEFSIALPNTIANVLTDHNKATHDALGIDADTVDTYHAVDFPRKAENATVTGTWTFDEELVLPEQPGDPGGAANTGKLYTKDDGSGNTELYYADESGNITKITPGGGGASTFLDLTDTPANYTGSANKLVRVNAAANALEFSIVLPNTIANVLTDHDKAAHDALGIDAATLDSLDSTDFVKIRHDYDASYHTVIRNPGGGYFYERAGGCTGAVKITLPFSWTATMMYIVVRGFDYKADASWEVICGGYNHSTGWINEFAEVRTGGGSAPFTRVRFGHDGSKCCIILGETNSVFDYSTIWISEVGLGYAGISGMTWETGWAITNRITDVSGITFTGDITNVSWNQLRTTNYGVNVDLSGTLTAGSAGTHQLSKLRVYNDGASVLYLGHTTAGADFLRLTSNLSHLYLRGGIVTLYNDAWTTPYVSFDSGTGVKIAKGLYVGSATTSPDANDVHIVGSINMSTALGCRVIRNAAQTIAHNTLTAFSFNSELYDTDACWAVGDPTKLYAKHAGYYMAGGGVGWAASAASRKLACLVMLNGSDYLVDSEFVMGENSTAVLAVATGMFYMAANHYVQIILYQNSGGNLDTIAGSSTSQHVANGWLVRVA